MFLSLVGYPALSVERFHCLVFLQIYAISLDLIVAKNMAAAREIDRFLNFKKAPASAPIKTNERAQDSSTDESPKTKKAKATPKPRLKKSTKPT
jgi:hypothetical protein